MSKAYKDSMGRYRTQSLFWESRDSSMEPVWSMKDYDLVKEDGTYKSLKLIYMSYDHVPGLEYDFAMDLLGSWDHWLKLCNDATPVIKDMIKGWRDELDIRLKAKGIKAIIAHSLDNDPKGLQAAKYLVEKGYVAKKGGRPSREEVERELKVDAKAAKEHKDDLERIGLKLVSNGD
tara:strand:+ start:893 stop:1420 length:528 start_codon:yes stop_codon:yes gene_type:complete